MLRILLLLTLAAPAQARMLDLVIDRAGKTGITVNGSSPGPVLRLTEGETVDIRVTNRLPAVTSIHWHGLLLPGAQDGSPGFNAFGGVRPGETFTYRFRLRQSGTYWYHAHSATQEQDGLYGALVIDPATPAPAEREHVLVFSEQSPDGGERTLRNLKADSGYYNWDKRTLPDLLKDARKFGLGKTLKERADWAKMRMDATDIADVRNYTLVLNGRPTAARPWFEARPGERVRLRIVNAAAMSFLDVRSPDAPMTVVAADGREVEPVTVDELRMGVAETYDVIVEPKDARPLRLYAETIDRRASVLAALAPAPVPVSPPERRPQPVLLLSEMGHAMDVAAPTPPSPTPVTKGAREGSAVIQGGATPYPRVDYGFGIDPMAEHVAAGHMKAMPDLAKEGDTDGSGRVFGWASGAPRGTRVLSMRDLAAKAPQQDVRPPTKEIVIKVQGNMERYIWTLNGRKFGEAPPVRVRHGERVRLVFVNETMMAHPMHLHGMFFQVENGQPMDRLPDKNVIAVAPGRTQSVLLTASEPGEWPLHCHLLYHMESGMMQKLVVATVAGPDGAPPPAHDGHAH